MSTSEPSQVDLAIIGGGINGAGLAAQAAQAGLEVLLLEKGDFASGTSSKSTKLFHGGIRYLEQGRFPLVFEGLHERYRLLQMVPHLARPIPFLLPSYQGDSRPAWMLRLGLWIYDFLAGTKNIARHKWLDSSQTAQIAPGLRTEDLNGCGLYYDAQVNDARLVLENILAAEKAGAHCSNYHQVTHVEKTSSLFRISYQDEHSSKKSVVTARCLVNASGPWANQTAALLGQTSTHLVRPTRGTHIVVPQVLSEQAVLITARGDNRIIFVIPWRGYSLVGTTDLDDTENPDLTHPTEEEMDYLLQQASRVFPDITWSRRNIIAAFAGLRPLAWAEEGHASSVSREDRILRDGNLLTIVGGKLTTYHAMARKALRQVLSILERDDRNDPSFDELPGRPEKPWARFLDEEVAQWPSRYSITPVQALQIARLYGQRSGSVLDLLKKDQAYREPLHTDRPELSAQIVFAVKEEKAVHLEDVMLRRLEIGYTAHRWGAASEKASHLMTRLLGWDETTRLKELERYRAKLYPTVSI